MITTVVLAAIVIIFTLYREINELIPKFQIFALFWWNVLFLFHVCVVVFKIHSFEKSDFDRKFFLTEFLVFTISNNDSLRKCIIETYGKSHISCTGQILFSYSPNCDGLTNKVWESSAVESRLFDRYKTIGKVIGVRLIIFDPSKIFWFYQMNHLANSEIMKIQGSTARIQS